MHFSAPKWKIFFNHGEVLNEFLHNIRHSGSFRSLEMKILFDHGEVLNQILAKV